MITARWFPDDTEAWKPVDIADISVHLDEPGGLIWVDAEAPDDAEISTIVDEFAIHHLAEDDLRAVHRERTRVADLDGMQLAVLQDCAYVDGHLSIREIIVISGEGWLLTVRKPSPLDGSVYPSAEPLATYERHRRRVGHDADPATMLLYEIVDDVVDRYIDCADDLQDEIDGVQTWVFGADENEDEREQADVQERIYRLRRVLVEFRRQVRPMREALTSFMRHGVGDTDTRAVVHFQDVYDHLLRVLDAIEAQQDLLNGAFEAHLAMASNRMNRVMKLMTSWGAILLGSSLIAGIYGMNFENMPELATRYGYFTALGAMAVLTIVLFTVFRKKDWL